MCCLSDMSNSLAWGGLTLVGSHPPRVCPLCIQPQVDDDFGNIYEAWRVMIEESENMWREKDMIPLNIFAAIRWVGASECPLSHAFGKPGERFAMLEPTSSHGTSTYMYMSGLRHISDYKIRTCADFLVLVWLKAARHYLCLLCML